MNQKIYKIALIIIGLLYVAMLQATHVAGGSMSYRCIGADTYEVSLEFRRDCFNGAPNAQFDEFASIGVFDADRNLVLTVGSGGEIRIPFMGDDTLNEILTSECNVIGGDVCVQTTLYRDTVVLPPIPGGYILAYQRCCRNSKLNNIADPLNTGATYWVRITEAALEVCNTSPQFNQWPNVFICVNDTLRFDHSAFDADGDSLVYFMCTPSSGATEADPMPQPPNAPPFGLVNYAAGFSENNMMGGSPISIDQNTGELIAVPDQVGEFLIGVCVREFRNGELLSEVRRDFEYAVRVCGRDPVAIITPEALTQCNDLEVAFTNESTSNFLPVDSLDFTWYFDFPDTTLFSNEMEPVFTFPEPGLYNVAMIVTDGVCIDTAISQIGVSLENDPTADFSIMSFDCDGSVELQITDQSVSTQPLSYEWIIISNGVADTFDVQNPLLEVGTDQSVSVFLTVTSESGCTDDFEMQDFQLTTIPLRADFIDKIVCTGDQALVFSTDNPSPNLEVTISPSDDIVEDGNGNFFIENFSGQQDFIVRITDGFCALQDTVTIDATAEPDFPLPDIIQCADNIVALNEFGPDFYLYNWESPNGVPIIANEPNPLVNVTQDEEFYVTVTTSPGSLCFFTDTVTVNLVETAAFNILPAEQFVYCENTTVNVSIDTDFPSIEWTDSVTGTSFGTGQTITLSGLQQSMILEVSVVDDFGCPASQFVDIQFIPAPTFTFDNNSDFNVCSGESATVIVDTEDDIEWFDQDGNLLGTGNTYVLQNVTEQTNLTAQATNDLGCQSEQQISIGAFPLPVIDFGNLDSVSICENQIFTLELPTNDQVEWFDEDGNALGSGAIITLDNFEETTSLTASVTNNFGCTVTDTFELTIDPNIIPGVDLADLDAVSTCIGNSVELTLDDDFAYVWTDINGNVISDSNTLTLEDVVDPAEYFLQVTDDRNCMLSDTFMVNVFEDIGLTIENGQDALVYCQDELFDVNAVLDVTADVQWLIDGQQVGEGLTLADFEFEGNAELVAVGMDQFGCADMDTISLVESISAGEITGDNMLCLGEQTTLTFVPALDQSFSLSWSPDDFTISETGTQLTIQPDQSTTFVLDYSNEDGCMRSIEYDVVVNGFFDGSNAFADPNEILFGESTDLSTDQDPGLDYQWEPAESLDDPTAANPMATPSETTTYTVTITDENGCTSVASVTVEVIQPNCDESDIFIPNMFTPNGDNFNDTWRIESNFIDEFELIVYNRWGEEVFASTDQNIEWDGTYKNKELAPDVYGYYLMAVCTNGFEYSSKGNVTLVK